MMIFKIIKEKKNLSSESCNERRLNEIRVSYMLDKKFNTLPFDFHEHTPVCNNVEKILKSERSINKEVIIDMLVALLFKYNEYDFATIIINDSNELDKRLYDLKTDENSGECRFTYTSELIDLQNYDLNDLSNEVIISFNEGEVINCKIYFEILLEKDKEVLVRLISKKKIEYLKIILIDFEVLFKEVFLNGRNLESVFLINDNQINNLYYGMNTEYEKDRIEIIFENIVKKNPDKIALSFQERNITYKELDIYSDNMASYLTSCEIKSNSLIYFYLKDKPLSIITILAILKIGCSYVPLDLNYPEERIHYILKSINNPILLFENDTKEVFDQLCNIRTLNVNEMNIYSEVKKDSFSKRNKDLNTIAYVNFTSGSTGVPKAVLVQHKGVVRLVKETDFINIDKNDVFINISPIAFDAATLEIWAPLLNGGTLILPPDNLVLNPNLLYEFIKKYCITTMFFTSALFNNLVDYNAECLEDLKYLIVGGDVVSVKHVEIMLKKLKNGHIINGYGPTENTTFSLCYRVNKNKIYHSQIPIGRPITNSSAFILNKKMEPLSYGIIGDLYVGGDGLSLGYLNNVEETKKRFINITLNNKEIQVYKTGDKASLDSDGNFLFHGRDDNQIKISGFRVELNEVEKIISSYSMIEQATVLLNENQKEIIAFIRSDLKVNKDDLMIYLKNKLPFYSIPKSIIQVPILPLNNHNKVDSKKLLKMFNDTIKEMHTYPPFDTDNIIINTFSENIKKDIQRDDNFFDLGFSSLMLMDICLDLNKRLNLNLNATLLFEYSTINKLLDFLKNGQNSSINNCNIRKRRDFRKRNS